MAKTVVGLFDSFGQAQNAVRELAEAGIDRSRIGVVTTEGASGDSSKEGKTATLAAGVGAAAIGALGLGMALGPVAIPGVGLIIAAGALTAGLAGAGIAASVPKVLRKLGVPDHQGQAYAEGLRRGGTLLTVEALPDADVERAVAIMKKQGAVDIQKRAQEWRQAGWKPEPVTPTMASGVVPGGLFVFSYEEEVRTLEAYPGGERRRSRQAYSGAERRNAA
jgi:hypothetical protein